jgi:hypothetical protein
MIARRVKVGELLRIFARVEPACGYPILELAACHSRLFPDGIFEEG